MKNKKRTTIIAFALLLIGAAAALAYIADRRRVVADPGRKPPGSQATSSRQPAGSASHRMRNLSLQPEAVAVARRLGKRFDPRKRVQSSVVGTVTIGGEKRTVRTVRTQTDNGELIEINLAGKGGALTWDSSRGVVSGGARAHGVERDLVERLVFDSPDQFVLAQLRGASYFTVARNVRPKDAGENYRGALWNIVRITDPEEDRSKGPQSLWRLYYIDTATGLIHRIESELNGRRIIAELSEWREQDGQQIATKIVWQQDGQTMMEYRMTSFAHVDKEVE
ncbi:MAG: hypothetical protein WAM70_21375 [Pyrinomonadaceae bacterium]